MNNSHCDNIAELIYKESISVLHPGGMEINVLKDRQAIQIADLCHCTVNHVYREALKIKISPYRYIRDRESISNEEQLSLAESTVAVVGTGGLGGHVILLLARIGIGHLIIIDNDVFDETNLNRQALCTLSSLGKAKAHEAAAIVSMLNPGVKVSPFKSMIDESNAETLLSGSDIVVDGLDNIHDRFLLEKTAKILQIPFVHGALSGFEGRIMTILPGDKGLSYLYGKDPAVKDNTQSQETILGIPALTPSIIATLQAMEVIKLILKRGNIFRNAMFHIDLENDEFAQFSF